MPELCVLFRCEGTHYRESVTYVRYISPLGHQILASLAGLDASIISATLDPVEVVTLPLVLNVRPYFCVRLGSTRTIK